VSAVGVSPSLSAPRAGYWVMVGEVTHATVPELHEQATTLELAGDLELDLTGVERIDSSALALLLSLARRARRSGGKLRILHAPTGLVSLAELSGVRSLLALTPG